MTPLLLPNKTEFEQAVLGAMLMDKKAIYEVKDMLTSEMFFDERHRLIFEGIQRLYTKEVAVDMLSLSAWLREAGKLKQAGDLIYLATLSSNIATSANVSYHALHIVDAYLRRSAIMHLEAIKNIAYDETVQMEEVESRLSKVIDEYKGTICRIVGVETVTLDTAYLQLIRSMEKQIKSSEIYGILTGHTFLDDYLGAIEPGLGIIAGRPGMGKTTLGMFLAKVLASNGHQGAFISLELTQHQIMRRFMAMIAGISLDMIKNPKLLKDDQWERINRAKVPKNLILPKMNSPYVNFLCMEIERLKNNGCKFVVIDQLNFIRDDPRNKKTNKNDELGNITRPLAELAMKLEIPIILLHQLNKEASKQGEPELHHLRDSGNIEQDARWVILVDVPFKRGIKDMSDGTSSANKAVIKVAKNGEGEAPVISIPTYYPERFTYTEVVEGSYIAPKIDFQPSNKFTDVPF